jgi:hypothetical protein
MASGQINPIMSTAQLNFTLPSGINNFDFIVNSCNVMSLLNNGNVGIGITIPSYKLDIVAPTIRIFDGTSPTNPTLGFITLNTGDVGNKCGHLAFYQSLTGPYPNQRAGYIGWGSTIGTANYINLYTDTGNGYSGYNCVGNFILSGTLGKNTANTDLNIQTYEGNNSGNINLSAIGASANINFNTNSINRLSILSNGFIGINTASSITYNLTVNGTIGILNNNNITIGNNASYIGGNMSLTSGNNDMISLTNSSTTANTNIKFINNATSNAFIGIGGTSTTILNSSYSNNLFLHSGCNIVMNAGANSIATKPHLFISNSGNVCIGVTVNNINSSLVVYSNISIVSGSTQPSTLLNAETQIINNYLNIVGYNAGDLSLNNYWGVAVNINAGGLGDSSQGTLTKIPQTSSFTVNTRTSSNSSGFDKTLFTIRNSGNIGVGTTNPQYLLDIYGSTLCRNGIGSTESGKNQILFSWNSNAGTNSYYHAINSRHSLSTSYGNSIDFLIWNTTLVSSSAIPTVPNMCITGSGIGIGTTNFPTSGGLINAYSSSSTLPRITLTGTEFYTVGGPFTSNAGIAQIIGVNRAGNRQLWLGDTELLGVSSTNPILRFIISSTPTIGAVATDGSTALSLNVNGNMTIFSNGNTGIGTTTTAPTVKLAVEGAVQCTTALTSIPATNTSCTIWNQSSVGGAIGGFRVAVYTGISTTMAQRLIVDENGSVGINTTAPSSFKLEINATGGALGNAFRIYDYGNANSGYISMNAGGLSTTTNQCGFISFYQPGTGQPRAGYIGWGTSYNSGNYLLLESEANFAGYYVTSNFIVNNTTFLLNNVGIGTNTSQSSETKLTINGNSTGTNPLVQITQNSAGTTNYALQVSGGNSTYTNLGGLRINGNDAGNTIYQNNLNTNISISQNAGNTTGGDIILTTYGTTTGNIIFNTNGNNRTTIFPSGNVGIATANDQSYTLFVNGTIGVNNNNIYIGTGTYYGKNIILSTNTQTNVPIAAATGGAGDRIIISNGGTGIYPASIGSNVNDIWFSGPQNTSYSWYSNLNVNMRLDSNANLIVWNDIIGFNSASDKKLKKDIKDLNLNCTELINKIKPVEFTWRNIEEVPSNKKNTIDFGFIAQDIELLLPNLVKEITSYKTINYDKFTPYLVKAIQEINKRLDLIEKILDL